PIFHRADPSGGQGSIGRHAQQIADALQRRVLVMLRVLRKEFPRMEAPVRRAADHIREGAATVDPEIPAAGFCLCLTHAMQTATASRMCPTLPQGEGGFEEKRRSAESLISARSSTDFADARQEKTS